MIQFLCAVADAVERLRHLGSSFRKGRSGPAQIIGPTRSAYLNLTIQCEAACAEVALARKAKKKAPFAKVRSLRNEMLKAELGRG